MSNDYLRERYGQKRPGSGLRSQPWFLPALITALIGISWLMWSALHYSFPEIRSSLISFEVVDSRHIAIRYSVSFRSTDKAHTCQLVAKDYQATIIGDIQDSFPAGTSKESRTTIIPTRAKAVNASIARCAVE